jgi:glycosyltransferase involved in cell wall biosynthesis
MKPLRICFVGLKCYDLLARAPKPRYFGGAERQMVFIAREFARRGHTVSFVTLDGGSAIAEHDGIRAFTAYAVDAGFAGLRFLHPRWTGLARALRTANAEIYYQMGADSETGQVAGWCRARRRRFVFATASDADCDPALPLLRTVRQRVLFRYGLKRANAVVSQTRRQCERLRSEFGVESAVIRNCTSDVTIGDDVYEQRARNARPRLLWVGRLVDVKRVELLLELATTRLEWDFSIVGSGDPADPYLRCMEARAASLPNVTFRRGIGDAELDREYRRANALVCTSIWEGVPTTFLEAWARGLPVVSTIDPDDVIAQRSLGAYALPASLAAAVLDVLSRPPSTWRRSREYFLRTHTIDASVSAHQRIFESVSCADWLGAPQAQRKTS